MAESAALEKRQVAFRSILGAVVITALKLLTGIATGSLGILSEAAHSGLDLVASGITYVSVRVSDKPADQDHLYGHQKFENFSALLEIGLLLLTSLWIIYEGVRRLLGHPFEVQATPAAFGVMIFSIAVDFLRSRALRRAAARYQSQALEADALHFSTDIWSSIVVVVGLVAVLLGERYGVRDLQKADAAAALGVAGIILVISVRLGRRSVEALLDAAPAGLAKLLEETLANVKGVATIERVRARHAGNQYFVDANIGIERHAPVEHAKSVSDAARAAIRRVLPGADVMIHTEPRSTGAESLFDIVKAVAARRGLTVHDLTDYDTENGVSLEFHLEVGEKMTLEAAHQMVSELEAEIQREAPQVTQINTHIENEGAEMGRSQVGAEEAEEWRGPLDAVARSFPEVLDCHEITVFGSSERPSISCHCVFSGDMPVDRVHEITSQIENRFRQAYPQFQRVTIHPEPHTVLE